MFVNKKTLTPANICRGERELNKVSILIVKIKTRPKQTEKYNCYYVSIPHIYDKNVDGDGGSRTISFVSIPLS
jgi:hypothetical protein